MGKGSKQPSSTTQTVTQDVPKWARPYYEDLLGKTKSISEEEYVPYPGQRLAQDSPDLLGSQQMIRSIAGQPIPGFAQAAGTMGGLGGMATGLGMQQPGQFSASPFQQTGVDPFSGFQQAAVSPFGGFEATRGQEFTGFGSAADQAQAFQFDPARQFSGAEVEQYMSPYMDTVVRRQQEDALEQFQRGQAARDASAVGAGAFGGSRQAVQQGIAEEALSRQLGDIQATGQQRAFEQAQQQFASDRAAQMEQAQAQAAEFARTQGLSIGEAARVQQSVAAERARIQAMDADEFARVQQSQAQELARTQGISVEEAARVQAAQAQELARVQGISVEEAARVQAGNASEQARVQEARANEAMRQREFQLQTMGFSADMAREIANLGERARAGDIQAAQLLEAQGLGEMAREQAGLDVAYQDFLRQQQFPQEQLGFYSSILRGLPVGDAGTTTTMQPQPSPFQQALGAGIGALGLYRGLTG